MKFSWLLKLWTQFVFEWNNFNSWNVNQISRVRSAHWLSCYQLLPKFAKSIFGIFLVRERYFVHIIFNGLSSTHTSYSSITKCNLLKNPFIPLLYIDFLYKIILRTKIFKSVANIFESPYIAQSRQTCFLNDRT